MFATEPVGGRYTTDEGWDPGGASERRTSERMSSRQMKGGDTRRRGQPGSN